MQLARWWSLNNAENSSDFAFLVISGCPSRSLDGWLSIIYIRRTYEATRYYWEHVPRVQRLYPWTPHTPSTCGRTRRQPGREVLDRPPYTRPEALFLESGQPQHISIPFRRRVHHSDGASICWRPPAAPVAAPKRLQDMHTCSPVP